MKTGNKPGSRWLLWLDRVVGIPVVTLLGCLSRRQSSHPTEVGRIALVKGDGMGDLVLLTGPLRDLRRKYPAAVISLFASSSVAPLGRELSSFDETHLINFSRPWRAIRQLRRWRPELVIDCGQWSRAEALIAGLSGAKFVIGFATSGQHRHRLYDAAVTHRSDCHELANFQRLLRPLGILAAAVPRIQLQRPLTAPSRRSRYVVFHMWPSGLTHSGLKEWPAAHWSTLAQACHARGWQVVLTGGRADTARARAWISRQTNQPRLTNKGGASIRETTELLAHAEAVVSVNTGVLHLAAALDVPTVGLHGPTSEIRWGALGRQTINLSVPPPHGGYLNLGFEYPADAASRPGMETITPSQVIDALNELVGPRRDMPSGLALAVA